MAERLPDGWAVRGVVVYTRWGLLVDHCVLRNWDRILVRAVKGLISRACMVSICPLLWQRDVKLQQPNQTDGWAVWGVVVSTCWWLLVDHCVPRNWDRILVRAVKELIYRAGMVSTCPLLWQRDVKLQQTNMYNLFLKTWHNINVHCISTYIGMLLLYISYKIIIDFPHFHFQAPHSFKEALSRRLERMIVDIKTMVSFPSSCIKGRPIAKNRVNPEIAIPESSNGSQQQEYGCDPDSRMGRNLCERTWAQRRSGGGSGLMTVVNSPVCSPDQHDNNSRLLSVPSSVCYSPGQDTDSEI